MSTPTMADRVDEYLTYRRALGYQLRIEGQMLQSFARYRRRVRAPGPADDRARPPLGSPAGAGDPAVSGPPAGSGADAGPVPGAARARHRGPAPRAARPGPRPEAGIPLLRGRHRRADRCGPVARPGRRPAPADVRHPDRADGLHRVADHRGPHPGGRRRRPGCRRPDDPPDQVPQVPARPAARDAPSGRFATTPRPVTAVTGSRGTRPSSCRTPAGGCPTRPCGTRSTDCCGRPCRGPHRRAAHGRASTTCGIRSRAAA